MTQNVALVVMGWWIVRIGAYCLIKGRESFRVPFEFHQRIGSIGVDICIPVVMEHSLLVGPYSFIIAFEFHQRISHVGMGNCKLGIKAYGFLIEGNRFLVPSRQEQKRRLILEFSCHPVGRWSCSKLFQKGCEIVIAETSFFC